MGFIESLAKGFVRSAVNQVGRDGGKVISNKIYKNRHSTPVNIIGGNTSNDNTSSSNNSILNRDDLKSDGYKVELFGSSLLFYVGLGIFGLMMPFVGPIVIIYYSLKSIFKKYTRFYVVSQKTVYVRDKRYKTGMRPEGYQNVKNRSDIAAIPTSFEKTIYIIKGVFGLIVSIGILAFHYNAYKSMENSTDSSEKFVVVNEGNGIQLKKDSTETSIVIKTIPVKDTVELLLNTSETSSSNWTKVRYKQNEGWISNKSLEENKTTQY